MHSSSAKQVMVARIYICFCQTKWHMMACSMQACHIWLVTACMANASTLKHRHHTHMKTKAGFCPMARVTKSANSCLCNGTENVKLMFRQPAKHMASGFNSSCATLQPLPNPMPTTFIPRILTPSRRPKSQRHQSHNCLPFGM